MDFLEEPNLWFTVFCSHKPKLKNCIFYRFLWLRKPSEQNGETRAIELIEKKNDEVEDPGLEQTANETNDPLEAVTIIHRYKEIIITQKKSEIG